MIDNKADNPCSQVKNLATDLVAYTSAILTLPIYELSIPESSKKNSQNF